MRTWRSALPMAIRRSSRRRSIAAAWCWWRPTARFRRSIPRPKRPGPPCPPGPASCRWCKRCWRWSSAVRHAIRTSSSANRWSAPCATAATALPLAITEPDGHQDDLQVSGDAGGGGWSFADTWQSGIYLVRIGSSPVREELFVANVDTSESDLSRIEPGDLPTQFTTGLGSGRRGDRRADRPAQPLEQELPLPGLGPAVDRNTSRLAIWTPTMSGALPNWLQRWLVAGATGAGEGTVWSLDSTWSWAPWITLLFALFATLWIGLIYARERPGGTRLSRAVGPAAAGDRRAGAC